MARAADVELRADEPFARAAARTVRVRSEELFAHSAGVLDTTDIERVHDMRVASRRLRAVLEIFAPCWSNAARPAYKAALRDVKDLADALGERRDPDVQIEALERAAAGMPAAQRAGVKALAERMRGRQAQGNERLVEALAHVERTQLRERLLALAGAAEERT
jgi:CHAD domain-containing protein